MSDDVIRINTEAPTKPTLPQPEVPIFKLVSEDWEGLREVTPHFDFSNPPVNPNQFASTLVETCKAHRGYGLSANQCGFKYRVFVMGADNNFVAFYNPEITEWYENSEHMVEGCLSFPFLGLSITRPAGIKVKYQDFNGEEKTAEYTGMTARIFQHEFDHLNGVLFTSKAKPLALATGMKKRSKIMKKLKIHYGNT